MKLSIITINYNNAEGLRKTLASVTAQTYRDIEHIIIDGGSTDGSVEVIKEYVNQLQISNLRFQIYWVSEPDKGIYNAMNKGIRKATGDYIWILNSGDCATASDMVERMMGVLDKTSNIQLLLGNIVKVYPDGRIVSEKKIHTKCSRPIPLETSMLTFYQGTVPQDAAFVRSDLFEKYGLFDENLKICADWKLYLNMIALSDVAPLYVDIDVVHFDMTGISNANNELRLAERRHYLEQVLPVSVLKDYDAYSFPIEEYRRLKKYHLWGIVYFVERVLFKLEKWGVLR
ncbi:MAG: glycosyltransferase [Paludibacteraceae bacterium]|nr:glycosyltransferase [Paludibacteraceae bacterium]